MGHISFWFAADVTLLGKKHEHENIKKRNMERVLESSDEVDLEVNAEKPLVYVYVLSLECSTKS
jgi:hypothetical protein